jgi:uncharacterized protein GlcG (DUF336 family)
MTSATGLNAPRVAATAKTFAADESIRLDLASDTAAAAVEACRSRGFLAAAAVVDREGQLKALLRANGAGPQTLESARRKAYTAVSLRNNTSAVLQAAHGSLGVQNLSLLPDFLILASGIPIRQG